jgi:hypothetical protein
MAEDDGESNASGVSSDVVGSGQMARGLVTGEHAIVRVLIA